MVQPRPILLAIEDVTRRREAEREKDELLQAKEILLQEMQHRVANSLQIIASILLLKARTVQSEETRGTCRTTTSASCRWQRYNSSCAPQG
jgi:two-component sensor histidine kinase